MLIKWHTDYHVASNARIEKPVWPDDWPIPRLGDKVCTAYGLNMIVTSVQWYPSGTDDDREPYVFVVLHY